MSRDSGSIPAASTQATYSESCKWLFVLGYVNAQVSQYAIKTHLGAIERRFWVPLLLQMGGYDDIVTTKAPTTPNLILIPHLCHANARTIG